MLEASVPFYPLSVGELVAGKYRINSVLGEGGMGIVFAATHVDLNCSVALKVIRQDLNQQPELVSRLMLEARAAAQIKSEHVCRVLDVARLDSGVPYVVMEYLEGKNLAIVLDARVRLTERLAVDYLLQACEAVAEAHRAGVVHRDLKPENLFLAEFTDGRRAIKVLDFGISKATGSWVNPVGQSLTNPSSAMGSPHYMAPEQMTAARDVDARADIWALGAILHQLVTGHLAFDGDSLPAVCAAVLQSEPIPVREYVPELSPGLEKAILRCLTKTRDQRLASVADFARLIAPFGSAQAAQSVIRIIRLLEDNESIDSSGEQSSGTLLSPRQLPTPRTPLRHSPVETTKAVTSSKRNFAAFDDELGGKRRRLIKRLGIPALLLGLFALVFTIISSGRSARIVPSTSALPIPPLPTIQAAAALMPQLPQSVAPQIEAAPFPNAVSSQTVSTARVASPKHLSATPVVHSSASDSKRMAPAASRDPYNSDNFGGRR